jgi:hypothetical protein
VQCTVELFLTILLVVLRTSFKGAVGLNSVQLV